jgi:hypothetical protein
MPIKLFSPLIGYMRVSKADGSQVLDLQKDAGTNRLGALDPALRRRSRQPDLATDFASGDRSVEGVILWSLLS